MKMVKIIGSVTTTIKDKALDSFKLFLVETVGLDLKGKKDYYIAVDTVGLGEGEVALMVTGSTAKQTDATRDRNVDGTLVAKVGRIDLG